MTRNRTSAGGGGRKGWVRHSRPYLQSDHCLQTGALIFFTSPVKQWFITTRSYAPLFTPVGGPHICATLSCDSCIIPPTLKRSSEDDRGHIFFAKLGVKSSRLGVNVTIRQASPGAVEGPRICPRTTPQYAWGSRQNLYTGEPFSCFHRGACYTLQVLALIWLNTVCNPL